MQEGRGHHIIVSLAKLLGRTMENVHMPRFFVGREGLAMPQTYPRKIKQP